MTAPLPAHTLTSAERDDYALMAVRDESGPDCSPLDDAAFFARMASRKLDAAPGEEVGEPERAARTLRSAISYLKSALKTAEQELGRIEYDHDLPDEAGRRWIAIDSGVSAKLAAE